MAGGTYDDERFDDVWKAIDDAAAHYRYQEFLETCWKLELTLATALAFEDDSDYYFDTD